MDLAVSVTSVALCVLVDGSQDFSTPILSIFYTEAGGSRFIWSICIYLHVTFQKIVTPIITALVTSSLTIDIAPEVAFVLKVKKTCWNLYQQSCHRQNRPIELKKGNVEQQLMYIKYTIQELGKIVHTARQHARKEMASNVATCTTNQKWSCGLTEYTSLVFCHNMYNAVTEMHMCIVNFVLLSHNIIFLFSFSLTLNIPSLAHQRCLSSCGPRRTPWFFCNFSTVWSGRLLKLCFLGFWNYNSVIQALLASTILCLFISTEVSQ